jgi:hypothetical protein
MPACMISLDEWTRRRAEDDHRKEALARLYERREAVDDLIRSLENYQRCNIAGKSERVVYSMGAR